MLALCIWHTCAEMIVEYTGNVEVAPPVASVGRKALFANNATHAPRYSSYPPPPTRGLPNAALQTRAYVCCVLYLVRANIKVS